jgi:SepF-like predicted cell division protein (DUF552 family)
LAGEPVRAFKRLFEKPKETPDEVTQEVPVLEVEDRPVGPDIETEPIYVKSMELKDTVEVNEIAEEVRRGNIVIADIQEFLRRDPAELRGMVEQLKEVCKRYGGDIGKLTDTKIIMTPKFIRIQFRRSAS